jgi:hypothetical protein
MKAIKILLKVIVAIIALVVVALLALPLWFGPVVKTVANSAVPKVVKTDFQLGHLHLNPARGIDDGCHTHKIHNIRCTFTVLRYHVITRTGLDNDRILFFLTKGNSCRRQIILYLFQS